MSDEAREATAEEARVAGDAQATYRFDTDALLAWAQTHLKLERVREPRPTRFTRYGDKIYKPDCLWVELRVMDQNAKWHTISRVEIQ